jgi:hypothetical protein
MSISGFIVAILTSVLFFVSNLMPIIYYDYIFSIMRWFNYLNITFALLGFILCFIGVIKGTNRILGVTGIVICGTIVILSYLELKGILVISYYPLSGFII